MTIVTDSWYPVIVEGCFQAVCTEYNATSVTEAVQGADIIIVALGKYFFISILISVVRLNVATSL